MQQAEDQKVLGYWIDDNVKGRYPFVGGAEIVVDLAEINCPVTKSELPREIVQKCEGKIDLDFLNLLGEIQSTMRRGLESSISDLRERQAKCSRQNDGDLSGNFLKGFGKMLRKYPNGIPVQEAARIALCNASGALARELLLKLGNISPKDINYVQGSYYPTSKKWRSHTFLVIKKHDKNYIIDPAQTLAATQRCWLPIISTISREGVSQLKEGNKVVVYNILNGSPITYSRDLELPIRDESERPRRRTFLPKLRGKKDDVAGVETIQRKDYAK